MVVPDCYGSCTIIYLKHTNYNDVDSHFGLFMKLTWFYVVDLRKDVA